ncbi:mannose-6-phosphate isomerase, class I [Cytobacillus oceanisediminis]|uniref:mannose-6-phosphate isomerase, class I n=1 Tax=Cytobacillus oceanisediminis TaxID=665099 RepID=UPI0037352FE0
MNQPLFFEPVFQERIWGGTALKDKFGYHIPSERTGECWAISAHPHGQSVVKSGPLKGKKIGELWSENSEIFGNDPSSVFPLLVKILDANTDLSVQVHPPDQYAKSQEHTKMGKDECWYVLDCKKNAEIVLGHNAKTKEELSNEIDKGKWDSLLRRIPINKGDFIFVPSGTIHALCEGTLVLEIQQNSNTTYRIYDYDRTDEEGNKRDLHFKKAIEVTRVPYKRFEFEPIVERQGGNKFIKFIKSNHFTIYKWEITEKAEMEKNHLYHLVSVINGKGFLKVGKENYELNRGDHLILPSSLKTFVLGGQFEAIVSHP